MALIGLLVLVFLVYAVTRNQRTRRHWGRATQPLPQHLPYQKRKWFFTRNEDVFYQSLQRAVQTIGHGFTIFAKVRMSDLVIMTKGTTGRAYDAALARVNQKHCDFVIIAPKPDPDGRITYEPVLAIELDDASHERPDRRQRDALVDAIYNAAGLPILHVPVSPAGVYDTKQLVMEIRRKLGLPMETIHIQSVHTPGQVGGPKPAGRGGGPGR